MYCAISDDMDEIFEAVLESELIILATPMYSWYCTPKMKAMLDRLVYSMNMYYGDERGLSLWSNKKVGIISTCGYPIERGADLFEEGMKRYCKHSQLEYIGMLCECHMGHKSKFMDFEKEVRAVDFAEYCKNIIAQYDCEKI